MAAAAAAYAAAAAAAGLTSTILNLLSAGCCGVGGESVSLLSGPIKVIASTTLSASGARANASRRSQCPKSCSGRMTHGSSSEGLMTGPGGRGRRTGGCGFEVENAEEWTVADAELGRRRAAGGGGTSSCLCWLAVVQVAMHTRRATGLPGAMSLR